MSTYRVERFSFQIHNKRGPWKDQQTANGKEEKKSRKGIIIEELCVFFLNKMNVLKRKYHV